MKLKSRSEVEMEAEKVMWCGVVAGNQMHRLI